MTRAASGARQPPSLTRDTNTPEFRVRWSRCTLSCAPLTDWWFQYTYRLTKADIGYRLAFEARVMDSTGSSARTGFTDYFDKRTVKGKEPKTK